MSIDFISFQSFIDAPLVYSFAFFFQSIQTSRPLKFEVNWHSICQSNQSQGGLLIDSVNFEWSSWVKISGFRASSAPVPELRAARVLAANLNVDSLRSDIVDLFLLVLSTYRLIDWWLLVDIENGAMRAVWPACSRIDLFDWHVPATSALRKWPMCKRCTAPECGKFQVSFCSID